MPKREFGLDFEEDVLLNRFKLEEEAELQPSLYYFYAKKAANARTRFKNAKAKQELDIRENPTVYLPDGEKLTEGYVKALIEADDSLTEMENEMLEFEAATKSLEDRRSEIKNLTEQFTSGYYSVPDGSRPSASSEVERETRKQLNRRTKRKEDK